MHAATDTGAAIRALAHGRDWLTNIVIVTTAVCVFLGPLAVLGTAAVRRQSRVLAAAAIGALAVEIICTIAKAVWYSPRPFVVLHFVPLFPHAADSSFPSGTTALAATAAMVLLLAFRRLGIVTVVGSLIVAFGCVYVGVHWVSDVVVGELLGLAMGGGGWWLSGRQPLRGLLESLDAHLPQLYGKPPAQAP